MTRPFRLPDKEVVVAKSTFRYARFDTYPVSESHMLVIPLRHMPACLDLTKGKSLYFGYLIPVKKLPGKKCAPDGCRAGMNVNGVAGGGLIYHKPEC